MFITASATSIVIAVIAVLILGAALLRFVGRARKSGVREAVKTDDFKRPSGPGAM
jgi:Sec-independent protein translocase protein TatA